MTALYVLMSSFAVSAMSPVQYVSYLPGPYRSIPPPPPPSLGGSILLSAGYRKTFAASVSYEWVYAQMFVRQGLISGGAPKPVY